MKKLVFCMLCAAVAACVNGAEAKKNAYDIRPGATEVAAPTLVEWSITNDARIAAATAPEAFEEYLTSPVAANRLLRDVKPNYATDPLKAIQVAAVSQYVVAPEGGCPLRFLCFWLRDRDDMRADWTAALIGAVRTAKTPDLAIFFLDQLRWCGYPEQADEIEGVTRESSTAVKEMARLVAAELRAAGVRENED